MSKDIKDDAAHTKPSFFLLGLKHVQAFALLPIELYT